MKKVIKLTAKETKVLEVIKHEQNEQGHSDFISTDVECKSNAGVVSSLNKKGLIYDSYSDIPTEDFEGMSDTKKRFKMWCLTEDGASVIGTPKGWERIELLNK